MLHLRHNDVIKWKHFPRYWPFMCRIHQSPMNSLLKGQWRGALMFSYCCLTLSRWNIHYECRPSEAWNTLFWPVHGSVDPPDQPWPFYGMSVGLSVRPSGEVSGYLLENAWRKWPEILCADVSWPSLELISLWPQYVDFSNFGTLLT